MDNINNSYNWKNNTIYHSRMDEYFLCSSIQGKTICKNCDTVKSLYSKFACTCTPSYCEDCLDNIKNCPDCESNQYFILSDNQIESLIKNKFSVIAVYKILADIVVKNNISGKFSLKNFVAKASDITRIYENLNKQITLCYLDTNNIYSFAADIWNIPERLCCEPNTAFCYKTMNINHFGSGYFKFLSYRWNCSTIELDKFELNIT